MDFSCQKFGLDLLNSILIDDSDKNIIYSPMSIYVALGMTSCGAHGETLAEINKTLNWNQNDAQLYHNEISKLIVEFNQGNPEYGLIKIANKLFVENSFTLLNSFKDVIKEKYNGGVDSVDFQTQSEKSRLIINEWVEKQTHCKIKNLLSSGTINEVTRLILVNAIYFKGSWGKKFGKCGKQDFHLLNNSKKSVEMINKSTSYPYLENKTLGFRAVQIPFNMIGGNNYSMMIILPEEKCSLPKIEKLLFEKEWSSILSKDLFEHRAVNITMPKFRIESSFKLKDVLQSLGMVLSFSGNADFSLITGKKELMIDDVIHKAFIDVDENGVEAAAATAVMMTKCCAFVYRDDPIEFRCDHPFMFLLMKDGSTPIFIGHLVDC